MAVSAETLEALSSALATLESKSCGDSSCVFSRRKGGMRTNGGCSCIERARPWIVAALANLYLAARLVELETKT